jgi:hypothetical protein
LTIAFDLLADNYLEHSNKASKQQLIDYLKMWKQGYQDFQKLTPNPKLKQIAPLYKKLAKTSSELIKVIHGNNYTNKKVLSELIKDLYSPIVDVEITSIARSFEKIQSSFEKNY